MTLVPFPPVTSPSDDRLDSIEARDAAAAELFGQLADTDSPEGREEIVGQLAHLYLDLAEALARRYRGRGEDYEELRQAACVGLMKAVRGYTLDHGTPFAAYAVPTITGELKRHFRDRCWSIRPTRRVQELHAELSTVTERLAQELGHEPSRQELAAALDEDAWTLEQALSVSSCYTPRSLDASVDTEGHTAYHSLLGVPEDGFEQVETHVALSRLVRELPDRDRRLLGMRFYEDLTQREIAERIGVTQMQVSRLLTKIFAKLRDGLDGDQGDVAAAPETSMSA
jgi:RNA polymerase sigma-B factor